MTVIYVECSKAGDASRAIDALLAAHFPPEAIYVRPSKESARAVPFRPPRQPRFGAIAGGLIGLLGGISTGVAAAIGSPLADVLTATLRYSLIGVAAGAVLGGLVGMIHSRSRPTGPEWIPFEPPLLVEVKTNVSRVKQAQQALERGTHRKPHVRPSDQAA